MVENSILLKNVLSAFFMVYNIIFFILSLCCRRMTMIKNFSIIKTTTPPTLRSELVHWLTHSHKEYELNFYVDAKATIFIKETGYFVNDKDILFIPANVEHSVYLSENYTYTRIVINFNDNFINWISQVLQIRDFIKILCDQSYHKISLGFDEYLHVFELFNKILYDFHSDKDAETVIHFYHLLKFLANNKNYLKSDSKIYEITRYLDENYKEDFSLKKLSELFYLNPSYISRLFKKQTGLTVVQYLQFRRVLAAHSLITYEGADIAWACYESGFGSIQHFYRVYKRLMGHSPKTVKNDSNSLYSDD